MCLHTNVYRAKDGIISMDNICQIQRSIAICKDCNSLLYGARKVNEEDYSYSAGCRILEPEFMDSFICIAIFKLFVPSSRSVNGFLSFSIQ